MNSDAGDSGLTVTQLWVAAWGLGLAAAICVVRLLMYAADGVRVDAAVLVWVMVGVVAAIFSANSAVLAALKEAEQRHLRRALREEIKQCLRDAESDRWFTPQEVAERLRAAVGSVREELFHLGHRDQVLETDESDSDDGPPVRVYRWSP